jgi:predicted secreted Zn-dependent protease
MEVNVSWQRNLTGTFSVRGATLRDVAQALEARDEWGLFRSSFTYRTDNDQGASSARFTFIESIAMPSWREYPRQTQDVREEWDRMWRALQAHEQGHRDIFEQRVNGLTATLQAMEHPRGGDVSNVVDPWSVETQREQDNYDIRTGHGSGTGVTLTY